MIVFNRRGVGLSDAPCERFSHEQAVEDATAVLDHAHSDSATVMASDTSGAEGILFAAGRSERTASLILINAFARAIVAPDYPMVLYAVSR